MDTCCGIEMSNFTLDFINFENHKFNFRIVQDKTILWLDTNNKRRNDFHFVSEFSLIKPNLTYETEFNNKGADYYNVLMGKMEPKGDSTMIKYEFNRLFFLNKGYIDLVFIPTNELNAIMIDYMGTIKGFPYSFKDNYWRMFYFSSVTVTTLGYGDIVPITNTSRTLISIEAILGVVLIGLFLNALSKRI